MNIKPAAAWSVTHSAAAEEVSMKYKPLPFFCSSAGSKTSTNLQLPIFWKFPNAFSSIVVKPPAIFPAVGWLSDKSSVASLKWNRYMNSKFSNLSEASFVAPLVAQTFSAPVSSEVSPKHKWTPRGSSFPSNYQQLD